MAIRTGLGHDLHRLVEGRPLICGGISIPFPKGEKGHSDGDVLVHAVIDALLGAAALGDIGELFPSSDPIYKDADSMELLKKTWEMVKKEGWSLINIDCCILCEAPKILPYREKIRTSLANVLETDKSSVFVKAKTGEGLGPVGEGNAIEAEAICLLERGNYGK